MTMFLATLNHRDALDELVHDILPALGSAGSILG